MMPTLMTRNRAGYRSRSVAMRRIFARGILAALLVTAPAAHSFEQLTPAQKLIYDRPHLSNTAAGQSIRYRYASRMGTAEVVVDRVLLTITKILPDDRRDVAVDFLSAERRMALPDFPGYRGNPVIIVMLEHIAQGFGRATGGGVLYFRNRIRDAMARAGVAVEPLSLAYREATIDATRVAFSPFSDDPRLEARPDIIAARFSIILSDGVPGGVVGVAVKSVVGGVNAFEHAITIE